MGPDVFLFLDQAKPVWEPHVSRSVETDGEGKAMLDNLKPGIYWLLARSQTQDRNTLWLRQVTIKEGDNEVRLDRDNALYFSFMGRCDKSQRPV